MPARVPRSGAKGNKGGVRHLVRLYEPNGESGQGLPNTRVRTPPATKTGANLGVYDVRTYESAYMLLGVVAGKMSKGNKLGASIPM